MNDDLRQALWLSLFYGLGAVGLFSIGALPLRALSHVRRIGQVPRPTFYVAASVLVGLAAVGFAAWPLMQLGRCLFGYHCSANSAGGWINAAYLGVIYVCFEFGLLVLRRAVARRNIVT